MKNIFAKLLIVVATFGMVGCSNNTQNENTTLGAITGAIVGGLTGSLIGQGTGQVVAIGAGAIAGAFVGGYVGSHMDHRDYQNTCNALAGNSTGQSSSWTNKRSGTAYRVTPTSEKISYAGNKTCRRFTTEETMSNGKSQTVKGMACQQKNGTWREVKTS